MYEQNTPSKIPNFIDLDEIFHKYNHCHVEKSDLFPITCDFKLVFDNEFNPHVTSDSKTIPTILRSKFFSTLD